jgi:hypothetical protein
VLVISFFTPVRDDPEQADYVRFLVRGWGITVIELRQQVWRRDERNVARRLSVPLRPIMEEVLTRGTSERGQQGLYLTA